MKNISDKVEMHSPWVGMSCPGYLGSWGRRIAWSWVLKASNEQHNEILPIHQEASGFVLYFKGLRSREATYLSICPCVPILHHTSSRIQALSLPLCIPAPLILPPRPRLTKCQLLLSLLPASTFHSSAPFSTEQTQGLGLPLFEASSLENLTSPPWTFFS